MRLEEFGRKKSGETAEEDEAEEVKEKWVREQ